MKNITRRIFLLSVFMPFFHSQGLLAESRTFSLGKTYLNIPVSHSQERQKLTFTTEKGETLAVDVRLSDGKTDYWVFRDVSHLKGKKLTVSPTKDVAGMGEIYLSDQIAEAENLYKEVHRPQYHFTPRRGWNNDPNGLIYYEGEYHLFFQHNPYERDWGNMHWGHAVSTDLVHWKELPLAMEPDESGTMFSGSAVIDYKNTSGFGKKGKPAMVAIYTADKSGVGEAQCIAYSLDNGRTFTKYQGNPVIDYKGDTRDPKVFWYEPAKQWVMALYGDRGVNIYTSPNLKDWTYQSSTLGFFECPDLMELPIEGQPGKTKWVMLGASQNYMIGDFDGKTFTPQTGKHIYVTGSMYAAQTYSNIPTSDGRTIQIGWGRISHPGMAFNSMMLLPTQLTLADTPQGLRLRSQPVKELANISTPIGQWKDISSDEANKILADYQGEDQLRLKLKLRALHSASRVILTQKGQEVINYDFNFNLLNGFPYSSQDFASLDLDIEIFMDKTSYEVFMDGGLYSFSKQRTPKPDDHTGFTLSNENLKVITMEIYKMDSIWK